MQNRTLLFRVLTGIGLLVFACVGGVAIGYAFFRIDKLEHVVEIEAYNADRSLERANKFQTDLSDAQGRIGLLEKMAAPIASPEGKFYQTDYAKSVLAQLVNERALQERVKISPLGVRVIADYDLHSFDLPRSVWDAYPRRTLTWDGQAEPASWDLALVKDVKAGPRVYQASISIALRRMPWGNVSMCPVDGIPDDQLPEYLVACHVGFESGLGVQSVDGILSRLKKIKNSSPSSTDEVPVQLYRWDTIPESGESGASIQYIAWDPVWHRIDYVLTMSYFNGTEEYPPFPPARFPKELSLMASKFESSFSSSVCTNEYMGCY